MNSSRTLPNTAKLSTVGSFPARKSQSFHLDACDRVGGGPGAPAASKSESRVACDPRSTLPPTAHTDLGNRMFVMLVAALDKVFHVIISCADRPSPRVASFTPSPRRCTSRREPDRFWAKGLRP